MRRFAVILIPWAWIPLCWQPLRGQSPRVGVKPSHKNKQQTELSATQAERDQTGTKESPLIVDVLVHPKSPEEAADAKAEKDHKALIEGWTIVIAVLGVLFNALLFIVGFRGIRYARRTLDTLKRQVDLTEPRLHIDSVRVAAFKNGQSPVFFVKVINSGIITAENVMIGMEAAIDPEKIVRYQKDQVIAIPADGSRECFIRSEMVLDQNRLAAYDNGDIPLRISGYVKWSGKTAQYCYKYNPWPSGNRPKGVPVLCRVTSKRA